MRTATLILLLSFGAVNLQAQCKISNLAPYESDGFSGSAVVLGQAGTIFGAGQGFYGNGLVANASYYMASQTFAGDISIRTNVDSVDKDGYTGAVSVAMVTAANEAATIAFLPNGSGGAEISVVKYEQNVNGTITHTIEYSSSSIALPIRVRLERVSGSVSAYTSTNQGSTWTQIGPSFTFTTGSDPTLLGLEAEGSGALFPTFGEGTFDTTDLFTSTNGTTWTQVTTQLSPAEGGANANGGYEGYGSITPTFAAGNLYMGPEVITGSFNATNCGTSGVLGWVINQVQLKNSSGTVLFSTYEIQGAEVSCSSGSFITCNVSVTNSGSGLGYVTLTHGSVYTFTSQSTFQVGGSGAASLTINKTMTLYP